MSHFCLASSNAHLRIYKRLYLWNEGAGLKPMPASAYLGDIRMGMPPYHAQLNVAMEGNISPWYQRLSRVGGHIGGFLPPVDDTPYWNTVGAMKAYTLLRDKALVRTRQHIPATVGRHRVGTLKAGQFINRDKG